MFYGQFRHAVDSKGRLIIPSKFRDTLRENYIDKFFVTTGFEHSLFVFTPTDWNQIITKLKEQPFTKEKSRDFMRLFLSRACEVECDRQGRIMLPQSLLKWAGIKKDVMVIGVLNRFEIWDEDSWRAYELERGGNYEGLAEDLMGVGL